MPSGPDLELSALVVCRDDDETVGHAVRRLATHLDGLGLAYEILALDEGSGDNTLSLLALLRREIPHLEVLPGVGRGRGFVRGAAVARGRSLLLLDGRSDAPLAALGFALQRLGGGDDAVVIAGRYVVLHRTRTLRLHGALVHHRDADELGRRVVHRGRRLGLRVDLEARRLPSPSLLGRLRAAVLAPLASRF